jgi:chromosome partitioning protein
MNLNTPQVITVAHQKGGVGKSTIACNLAVELAKNYKLNVVDLDMQKSLTYFNAKRGKLGMPTFNIINVQDINELKKCITGNDGLLLIDVGGFDSDLNRIAIFAADKLITPVSDSEMELVGLLSFRKILQEIKVKRPDLLCNIVVNRAHPLANKSLQDVYDFIERNKDFKRFKTILRDRIDYKKAFSEGKSVVEYGGRAKEEFNNLIDEVIKEQQSVETQNVLVYNVSKKWLQIIKREKYSMSTYIKLAIEAKLREEGKI